MKAERNVTVHRFEASLFPVNAYLVETNTSVLVVDATLGVSDGKRLRWRVDALRKPHAAVIITHSHPDHYGGVNAAPGRCRCASVRRGGVNEVIR
jgi:glyoxylase-like metal-dependent hydrolase (beta-lactamase superfamily II)